MRFLRKRRLECHVLILLHTVQAPEEDIRHIRASLWDNMKDTGRVKTLYSGYTFGKYTLSHTFRERRNGLMSDSNMDSQAISTGAQFQMRAGSEDG